MVKECAGKGKGIPEENRTDEEGAMSENYEGIKEKRMGSLAKV